jgi:hypothetical protein
MCGLRAEAIISPNPYPRKLYEMARRTYNLAGQQ